MYGLSLEKCIEGIDKCGIKYNWIKRKIKQEICSSILMGIMIQFIIFGNISRKHLIHILFSFSIFLLYSHGVNFHDHGYYNFFYFILIISIITIFLIPLDIILCCKKKKNSIKIISIYLIILLLLFFAFSIFLRSVGANCNDWPKGLNNTYIKNDEIKYRCQIQIPKLCFYKILEYVQDYTQLSGKNCKNYRTGKDEKDNLLDKSTSNKINTYSNLIGYPLFNKEPVCFLDFPDYDNLIKKFFLDNLVDIENEELENKINRENKSEIEIRFF